MRSSIIKISLVIIWMIVIFFFSNQKAVESSKLSDGLIKRTISIIIDDDSNETVKKFVKPVRKTAHFCIYLILGLLVLNCFSLNRKNIIYAIIICLLYSISDEVHQMYIDGRSSELMDVYIDTLGASIGVLFETNIRKK